MTQVRQLTGTFVLSFAAGTARAQTGVEVAAFYWLFIGGSAALLLILLGWLVYVLLRSRKSKENEDFRGVGAARGHGGRLGE